MRKILIVDDQFFVRQMMADFFTGKGMHAEQAEDGLRCLNETSQKQFDVIFLDVRMPELGGIETLKKLRLDGNHTKVIMMSGFGAIESEDDAIRLGANGFLSKPFRLENALQMIQ